MNCQLEEYVELIMQTLKMWSLVMVMIPELPVLKGIIIIKYIKYNYKNSFETIYINQIIN